MFNYVQGPMWFCNTWSDGPLADKLSAWPGWEKATLKLLKIIIKKKCQPNNV